jgi:hypothetical protein
MARNNWAGMILSRPEIDDFYRFHHAALFLNESRPKDLRCP